MAKKTTMGTNCLKDSTLLRSVELKIDGDFKILTVGKNYMSKFFYTTPDRESVMATYNYALWAYAHWQKEILNVYTNLEKTEIYLEIEPSLCIDEYKSKFACQVFAKQNDTEWDVTFSKEPPTHIKGYVMAVISAIKMDLFNETVKNYDGSTRENHPAFFCDAIYNGYCKTNDFNGFVSSSDDVAELFATGDMHPLFEASYTDDAGAIKLEEIESSPYYTWESCLKGEHRIDYDWAPEAAERIPDLSILDKLIPTKEFMTMLNLVEYSLGNIKQRMDDGITGEALLGDDVLNLKLSGPPGSGKSFALKCLAAVLGLPFWVTSFNPNSDESFAEGKTRMVDGEPKHTDSPLTMCQMYGGISCGEEPNTADPEMVFGVYSQIVESPYTLYRNGSEAVIRHPLSVYAILYNKNCGSATMHAALLNRFNQPFEFQAAEKDEFIKMLIKRTTSKKSETSGVDTVYKTLVTKRSAGRRITEKKLCEWVYKAYNCTMNSLDSSSGKDAAEAISLRSCFGLMKAIEAGEDSIEALRCLYDNIGDFDEELMISVKKSLHSTMRAI